MQITRISEAKPYEAARHVDVSALHLQGMEATDTENFWCGLSHYLPGGRADKGSAPLERIYVVLEGEITVTTGSGDAVLGPLDSCHIAPGEERTVENRANGVAAMLVIMPNPPKE
jgi:quercetin dioxygenase-like cupin family protein